MNIYATPLLRFGDNPARKVCIILCLWAIYPVFADSLQQKLLPLFLTLESPESDPQSIATAIEQILESGPAALPLVKKRLEQTGHYRYLYVIEKFGNPGKTETTSAEKAWDKDGYFRGRFRQAQKYLQQGNADKAQATAQAILTLEPEISFREEIATFLRQCKNTRFTQIVHGQIDSRPYSSPGKSVSALLSLKNGLRVPVTIATEKYGIVLEMTKQEYDFWGGYFEERTSQILPLDREIELSPGEIRETRVDLSHLNPAGNTYRVLKIKAKLPRCKVSYSGTDVHPDILFPEISVISFPAEFHQIISQPLDTCESALMLGYPEHLFFASFFLRREDQARLIPKLIEAMGHPAMDPLITGILRRFTGKNFAGKNSWQNWWYAHSSSWAEELPGDR